eukprot:2568710-Amphidinium_carterae.1
MEQNEVILAVPLYQLLARASRVLKLTQYVVVAPSAFTFEQGMQTEAGVTEAEALFVDQSMDVEAIQLEVWESDKRIIDACCRSLVAKSVQMDGCESEKILFDSRCPPLVGNAVRTTVGESEMLFVDFCCLSVQSDVIVNKVRRRKQRSWVSDFMDVPVSHLFVHGVSDTIELAMPRNQARSTLTMLSSALNMMSLTRLTCACTTSTDNSTTTSSTSTFDSLS